MINYLLIEEISDNYNQSAILFNYSQFSDYNFHFLKNISENENGKLVYSKKEDQEYYAEIQTQSSKSIYINYDSSIYYNENNYIFDKNNKKIYVDSIFFMNECVYEQNNVCYESFYYSYLIDRQQNIYTLSLDDNIALLHSEKKVVSIGKGTISGFNYGSFIIVYDDNTYLEIYPINYLFNNSYMNIE